MVARTGKMTAKPGQGEALADRMLAVAESLRGHDGCHLYLISRAVDAPDEIWITELWRSQEDSDASLEASKESGAVQEVMAMLAAPPEGTDLIPLGGPGFPDA